MARKSKWDRFKNIKSDAIIQIPDLNIILADTAETQSEIEGVEYDNKSISNLVNPDTQNNLLKKSDVDCDIIICIPSHNRYNKIKHLLTQFYSQPTKYSFKIVLLNDGSDEIKYDSIPKKFKDLIYIKNPTPNGKALHWACYSQMWSVVKHLKFSYLLQMDDDFILCDNFLDKIVEHLILASQLDSRVIGIAPHLWSFSNYNENIEESWWKNNNSIDGIGLFHSSILKDLNYSLQPVSSTVSKIGHSVQVWNQFRTYSERNNKIFARTSTSLVFHDGNDDSQLHTNFRNKKKIYSQRLDKSLLKYVKK